MGLVKIFEEQKAKAGKRGKSSTSSVRVFLTSEDGLDPSLVSSSAAVSTDWIRRHLKHGATTFAKYLENEQKCGDNDGNRNGKGHIEGDGDGDGGGDGDGDGDCDGNGDDDDD
mmetsp:Transcript_36161/g.84540  ORF Transcript_36161/g.84540 Transcript_36161/m.84540 type:complete len:113 (+) Transcript_36161:363-701(+)